MTMRQAIRIHGGDNVAVALQPLAAGAEVVLGGARVLTRSDIPRGHKLALGEMGPGEPVIKYGFPIGRATRRINAGDWVHTHNLGTALDQDVE